MEEIRRETHRLMIRALDSHPLICEDLVLCEMSREKLHRFKLDRLKAIRANPLQPEYKCDRLWEKRA